MRHPAGPTRLTDVLVTAPCRCGHKRYNHAATGPSDAFSWAACDRCECDSYREVR